MKLSPFNFLHYEEETLFISNSFTGNIIKIIENDLIAKMQEKCFDDSDKNIKELKRFGYIVDDKEC